MIIEKPKDSIMKNYQISSSLTTGSYNCRLPENAWLPASEIARCSATAICSNWCSSKISKIKNSVSIKASFFLAMMYKENPKMYLLSVINTLSRTDWTENGNNVNAKAVIQCS